MSQSVGKQAKKKKNTISANLVGQLAAVAPAHLLVGSLQKQRPLNLLHLPQRVLSTIVAGGHVIFTSQRPCQLHNFLQEVGLQSQGQAAHLTEERLIGVNRDGFGYLRVSCGHM